jgi:predicted NBD/HSP70 family sugar kinase
MQNSNTVCLNGKPLKTDLEKLLNIQVFISNDANCFALAESLLSDVAKFKPEVVFGIIMGTGVGGGIVVQDEVLNGLHGIAGEWGHNFLDRSGGTCYCGKVGCVETIISGTALEKFFYEKSGFQRKLPEIVELADNNDANAQETLNRLHYFFGKAIAHVINILDPDVVIVGGGVGNIDTIYTHGVKSINQFLFNNRLETKIVKPSLGDSAGVYGAALLCKRFG